VQMKLPASLGQKKTKAIEQMLEEVGVGKALFVTCCIFGLANVQGDCGSDCTLTLYVDK